LLLQSALPSRSLLLRKRLRLLWLQLRMLPAGLLHPVL
jgi:hypothetical protein